MKPMKIFIVDDDPEFSEGLALILEIDGHEVAFAKNGEEAVDMIRQRDFDVTLMDFRMPGMNGYQSFQAIREVKPDTKVILMTAYSGANLLRQAIAEGAMGVLHKPIDSKALLNALKAVKPGGVILMADDDPDFAEATGAVLTAEGYQVSIARSGQEAVEMVLGGQFDVLLLDVRMPVLNGLGVYRELLKHGRTLPTIIVTGYAAEETENIELLQEMSAKRCLVKPIGAEDLLRAIEELV